MVAVSSSSRRRCWTPGAPGAAGVSVALLDVTDRAQREAMLAFDATHDDLTDLLNRAALFPVLEQALARHRRHRDILAVLFIDLDHFKEVNDRHGHAAGNDVLRTFAGRLRRAARVEDTIARIGGDEFAVFCEGLAAREEAVHVAVRLIEATAQPFEGAAADMRITATVGIAYAAAGCDTPRSLLDEADVAMYDDKRLRGATETVAPGHRSRQDARGRRPAPRGHRPRRHHRVAADAVVYGRAGPPVGRRVEARGTRRGSDAAGACGAPRGGTAAASRDRRDYSGVTVRLGYCGTRLVAPPLARAERRVRGASK